MATSGTKEAELDKAFKQLSSDWDVLARDKQKPPDDPWSVWIIRAGRGFGKTRSGAEWMHKRALEEGGRVMALVGKTPGDARDDCIEGPGGILPNGPHSVDVEYEPSKRRLTWPNGSYATIFSGANPDQLRGFSGDTAWCDEMASWDYPEKTWQNLMYGLREGDDPKAMITTTPRPIQILKDIEDRNGTVVTTGSSYENRENLSDKYFETVIEPAEGTSMGEQEIHAQYIEDRGLWGWSEIEKARNNCPDSIPNLQQIVIGVDPATTSNEDSDETGIVAAGKSDDGSIFVLDDASMKGTPNQWAAAAVNCFHKYRADKVVAEVNQGGDMVESMMRQADSTVPFDDVRATRGKELRAQPVVARYERGEVYHARRFAKLESQMVSYTGEKTSSSPDRMDAMVWAVSYLDDDSDKRKSASVPGR